MDANTTTTEGRRRFLLSKTGGGAFWAAGFLFLLMVAVRLLGEAPQAVVSLEDAMGQGVEIDRF